ncbi:hypothetical protein PAE9249_00126 [Paenibacillus sp. CECT 9249]|uniref:DUF86 domain-containing protein n=1 Tax=Paenibacillus sp. CECT 9249 TaxID=2845385 RepID=UPI001E58AE49|nr:HepT-like ribonuclease domain-containing protein [Paenibacillus sp. CECT 9249]CAH0117666.1 hypothetical protein PAE9249_00126 [Paenibacillus sp. CECT 9249]
MYYVNQEQIELRLRCIPGIVEAMQTIMAEWDGGKLIGLAQERALHLAIEIVTDVGSYLIDGFIMRDASSYEDIVEIIGEEGVFPSDLLQPLTELVRLRRPLVQDYYAWNGEERHPLLEELPDVLRSFEASIRQYLDKELGTVNK